MEGQGSEERRSGRQSGLPPQDQPTESSPVLIQETPSGQPITTTMSEACQSSTTGVANPVGIMLEVIKYLDNSRREAQESHNRFLEALLAKIAPTTSQPEHRVSLDDSLHTHPSTVARAVIQPPLPPTCHKRKTVEQEQNIAKNSKAHVVQSPPIQSPTSATVLISGLTPCPPMQTFQDNLGNPLQNDKTSKIEERCYNCHNMGHYARQCLQKSLATTPDNIPEATLIATITP